MELNVGMSERIRRECGLVFVRGQGEDLPNRAISDSFFVYK